MLCRISVCQMLAKAFNIWLFKVWVASEMSQVLTLSLATALKGFEVKREDLKLWINPYHSGWLTSLLFTYFLKVLLATKRSVTEL